MRIKLRILVWALATIIGIFIVIIFKLSGIQAAIFGFIVGVVPQLFIPLED